MSDIQHVLRLCPDHFGAMSGAGMVHMKLRDFEAAKHCFEKALTHHPWMSGVRAGLLEAEAHLRTEAAPRAE